jgi:uncharacterized membrane protein YfcA
MLTACTLGMAAGLGIDDYDGRVATLAEVCATGGLSFASLIQLHWQELPAMHAGMIIGAIVAIPRWRGPDETMRRAVEILRAMLCYASMLIGMEAAMWIIPGTYNANQPGATMLAMMLGMTCGLLSGATTVGFATGRFPLVSKATCRE